MVLSTRQHNLRIPAAIGLCVKRSTMNELVSRSLDVRGSVLQCCSLELGTSVFTANHVRGTIYAIAFLEGDPQHGHHDSSSLNWTPSRQNPRRRALKHGSFLNSHLDASQLSSPTPCRSILSTLPDLVNSGRHLRIAEVKDSVGATDTGVKSQG